MYRKLITICLALTVLSACNRDKKPLFTADTLFTLLDSSKTGVDFANVIDDTSSISYFTSSYIYNGGGVATGDLNNDGLQDLVFTGNQVDGKVYRNKGEMQFQDVTESSGFDTKGSWTTGVTLADINGDGWLDIYVCKAVAEKPEERANLLFINQHDFTFKEQAGEFGLADTTHSIHANFFDMDNDGDLDAYILEYPHNFNIIMDINVLSSPANEEVQGVDRLYRNDNGKFTDVTAESGLLSKFGFGLSATATDINFDGLTDLFIANDYMSPDLMLVNKGNGKFEDESKKWFDKISFFSMGADFGDINNDGLPDLLVVDMAPIDNYRQKMNIASMPVESFNMLDHYGIRRQYFRNMLQLRTENGFSEIGELAGVAKTDWSWGALFADWDNDSWQDIYIAKGTKRDLDNMDYTRLLFPDDPSQQVKHRHEKARIIQGMPAFRDHNYIFINNGDLTFTQKMQAWGVNQNAASSGCAYADLDNDGDLDLVVNNTDIPAFVYRNNKQQIDSAKWLRIALKGNSKNTFGLGAKCYLYSGSQKLMHEMNMVRGYQSSSEPFIHFGLGKTGTVDSLKIIWTDGTAQTLRNVSANQTITVLQQEAEPQKGSAPETEKPLLAEKEMLKPGFKHTESSFNDFKRDRLLHRKFSCEGPGVAIGDLNQDGLDDVFIGNANGNSSAVYFQDKDGNFIWQKSLSESIDTSQEHTGALIIDINNDGYSDLITNSGSNEFTTSDTRSGTRLYLNNGKGGLISRQDMLPEIHSAASVIVAADFDKDGYKDLFVGGRLIAGRYPEIPASYLLKNEGGKTFTDVTDNMAAGLRHAGLVTSALFTDYDNDGWLDLAVVGEWMPVTFFKNKAGKKLEAQNIASLQKTNGWWNSINGGDFDNDGDIDYVLGNWGENMVIKANEKEPATLYAADFDKNGSVDPILMYYIQGVNAPFATRDMLCEKMPSFFNKFNTYDSYAKAGIEKILNAQQLDTAAKFTAYTMTSSYLQNNGSGKFELRPLPKCAQVSATYGTLIFDFNNDGYLDVLLTGNAYSFYLEQGNLDAGRGCLLKGDGKGNFAEEKQTSLNARGDAKSLAATAVNNALVVFQLNNNSFARTYTTGADYHLVKAPATAISATTVLNNGQKRKTEFYYGNGYLSQSGRYLQLPEVNSSYSFSEK